MICLACGDCCNRMSPLEEYNVPCRNSIKVGSAVFCRVYINRPDECASHTFPAAYCPIGMDILELGSGEVVGRIGYIHGEFEKIKGQIENEKAENE